MHAFTVIASVFLSMIVAVSAASAATYTWTEGNNANRKLVKDSRDLEDADPTAPGFELGDDFGSEDTLQIHGRIVSSQDTFSYNFSMATNFSVAFDLDGYILQEGNVFESNSGLVGQTTKGGDPTPGEITKGVRFILTDEGGNTQTLDYTTDILLGSGVDPFIFSGRGGEKYTLTVDGSIGPEIGAAALYDVKIAAAVPIPAAAWLFGSGLIGLVGAARRQRS